MDCFFLVSIITVVVHLSALLRFILLLALRVLNACLCFAVRLEKVIEAISSFVRSVWFSKTTDGCGAGCHLDLTWNRWASLFELANTYHRRIERVKSLNSWRSLLHETGTGRVEMNFGPFASKVISWSVRFSSGKFFMNFSLFVLILIVYWVL